MKTSNAFRCNFLDTCDDALTAVYGFLERGLAMLATLLISFPSTSKDRKQTSMQRWWLCCQDVLQQRVAAFFKAISKSASSE